MSDRAVLTMVARIALVLAVLAVPAATPAQERLTVDSVLERFATAGEDDLKALNSARNDATDLLRQVHGPLSAEEIATLFREMSSLRAEEADRGVDQGHSQEFVVRVRAP